MTMTKKDYILISGAVHRTRMIMNMDKNSVRKQAKQEALHLLATDLTATLKHDNPLFDEDKFLASCGM